MSVPAFSCARGGGEARRAARGRPAARAPDHLARREPDEADDDALSKSDDELEAAARPSYGHCNEMGTASTMTSLVEALGMTLPGTASIPAATRT